jgi:hypothetical protein
MHKKRGVDKIKVRGPGSRDGVIEPVVVEILDREGDVILRGEEDSIRDLSGVLLAGGLGLGMRRVEVDPAAHLGAVQAGHNPVHNVLQRFVRPATTYIKNY